MSSSFGVDFGQKVDLTASIRNILRNYPEGTAVLKELVQNADDAGAHCVSFCLDHRSHHTEKLADQALAQFQDPALMVYNDAIFTEEDFKSIQRIGDSLKKSSDTPTKIGRFGIGFNAVYHWTDLPSFISSKYLVLLDPQARFLPNVNPSNPGKMVDWISNPKLLTDFRDQFSPYEYKGLNWMEPFSGTIFRLPLRTYDQAETSMLSKRALSLIDAEELLHALQLEASAMLLFLKSIEKIEISQWLVGNSAPKLIYSCEISNADAEMRRKRSFVSNPAHLQSVLAQNSCLTADYSMEITCHSIDQGEYTEQWEICNQLGGQESNKIASDQNNALLRLIPWGGVASCVYKLSRSPTLNTISAGLAYCFLPLPIQTGLPVMINGFFELSSNRRDVWQAGADMTGDGRTRAQWNISLMKEVIAQSYIRLLVRLKEHLDFSSSFQSSWPSVNVLMPWSEVVNATLLGCKKESLLKVTNPKRSAWISSDKAILLPTRLDLSGSSAHNDLLTHFLMEADVNIVICMESMKNTLEHSENFLHLATPSFVRSLLQQSLNVFFLSKLMQDNAMSKFLIQYCMSDIIEGNKIEKLNSLPIIPLMNDSISSITIFDKNQLNSIKELQSMGFSLSKAITALTLTKFDVIQSCDLLTTNDKLPINNESIVLIGNTEEVSVFSAASSLFIDKNKVGANEIEFIASTKVQEVSNIKLFDSSLVPDLLLKILPNEFSLGNSVPSTDLNEEVLNSTILFVESFWKYASSNSSVISAIAQGVTIVPTKGFQSFHPLSRISNLIASVRGNMSLSESILRILEILNVNIVENSIFHGEKPMPNVFWEYVNSPSRTGVLLTLKNLSRSSNDVSLQLLSGDDKETLKQYMSTVEPIQHLAESEKEIIRSFPIFMRYSQYDYVNISHQKEYLVLIDAVRIPEVLIPSNFLCHKSQHELDLYRALGVPIISRSQFFISTILKSAAELYEKYPEAMEDCLVEMFSELKSLNSENEQFITILQQTKFVPPELSVSNNHRSSLCRADELFDPADEELSSLLDTSFFPIKSFCRVDILVLLRSIGLQSSLQWPGIIACANSIATTNEQNAESKIARGRSLLKFLDKNIVKLSGEDKKLNQSKPFSLFSFKSLFGEKPADETTTVEMYIEQLKLISWVPVLTKPLHDCMPWPDHSLSVSSAPVNTCSMNDAWLCSWSRRIVSEHIHSPSLKTLLGWNIPYEVSTIALQLREMSNAFMKSVNRLEQSSANQHQILRETVTGLIPQLYQRLNSYTEVEGQSILSILSNCNWIWVGEIFVSYKKVALSAGINATPYLYQLPQDLQVYNHLLSLFSIKTNFSTRDYVDALLHMADDAKSKAESGTSSQVLSDRNIDIAVSLATLLSTEIESNQFESIFIPDTSGRLCNSRELVNDDVPWLSGPEYFSIRSGCRMVHPNISTRVAEKLGAKSLRLTLVNQNLEQSIFSSTDMESFGQAESLTSRLKTILDMYPDGNPIFSELIQNADDAGASVVSIMLDENSYATESLLDGKMAPLQGPSIIVRNDAKFSERDFRSLARIGQGSKLEKLSTTGRFGLGFNSTYHITDTPTFVSGEYFVIFDPHCDFAPGATINQPGLKIKYHGSNLVTTFPNQFEPFNYFGCNFDTPYEGTLFRFPLRSASLARKSEISKRSYSILDVESNLQQLVHQLPSILIFLRSVKAVEIYRCQNGSKEPILLHRAISRCENQSFKNDQSLLKFFDKNPDASVTPSRDIFYNRLLSTPDLKLPRNTSKMHIEVDTYSESAKSFENSRDSITHNEIDYLIVSGLCGGEAKRMACNDKMRQFKLVPFGSVAACIQNNDNRESEENTSNFILFPKLVGQAFCFLPLPVQTNLPVHVNAYWELSSNRRDIWKGDDTQGEARLRSDWNIFVMRDVLAPLYANLLLEVIKFSMDDPKSAYNSIVSLLPSPTPPAPWNTITSSLFPLLKEENLLWSNINGGTLIPMQSAYLLSETSLDIDSLNRLEQLLLKERVPVVVVPDHILATFLSTNCIQGEINPSIVRQHFDVSNVVSHPVLTISMEDGTSADDVISNASFLLQYCFKDIKKQNYSSLIGLKLLPLDDKTLGIFLDCDNHVKYYLVSEVERKLLVDAGRNIVCKESKIGAQIYNFLKDPAFHEVTNVTSITPLDTLKLIRSVLPTYWFASSTNLVDRTNVISDDWLTNLWNYILDSKILDLFKEVMPMLPVVLLRPESQTGSFLVKISLKSPVLHMNFREAPPAVINGLSELGIYVLDQVSLGGMCYSQDILSLVSSPDAKGLLNALSIIYADLKTFLLNCNKWSNAVRYAFQEYILDFVVTKVDKFTSQEIDIICSLPIWIKSSENKSIVDVLSTRSLALDENIIKNISFSAIDINASQLPPRGIDRNLFLESDYLVIRRDRDRSMYHLLGIKEPTKGLFYASYLFPRLVEGELDDKLIDNVAIEVLKNLSSLEIEHAGLSTLISDVPFIRNNEGNLCTARSLYDPEANLIKAILPAALFPNEKLYSVALLPPLRQIGLNLTVGCDAIIKATEAIQSDMDVYLQAKRGKSSVVDDLTTQLAEENGLQHSMQRAVALLRYLDSNVDRILLEADPIGLESYRIGANLTESNDLIKGTNLGGNWSEKLRSISWIPVFTKAPTKFGEFGLPWPGRIHSTAFAAPSQTMNPQNIWLCSSTFRICSIDVSNELLLNVLGWNKPISGRNIALQLLNIKLEHDRVLESMNDTFINKINEIYQRTIPQIFSKLFDSFKRESPNEIEVWSKPLYGKQIIWMAGKFIEPTRIAFNSLLIQTEPYLYIAHSELMIYKPLLINLGAKETFEPIDLANLTRELHQAYSNTMLSPNQTKICLGIIKLLYDLLETKNSPEDSSESNSKEVTSEDQDNNTVEITSPENIKSSSETKISIASLGQIFMPDNNHYLLPSTSLTYDDAPWISSILSQRTQSIRLVHGKIDMNVAKLLGCKSLREQLFAGEEVVCPSPSYLNETLTNSTIKDTMLDLIALADSIGSKSIKFIYDERPHPTESLIHPGLLEAQGPALVAFIDSVILSSEEISKLLSAATPVSGNEIGNGKVGKESENAIRIGNRFLSAFVLTDCLQIISGNEFFIFDPCGKYLTSSDTEVLMKKKDIRSTNNSVPRAQHFKLKRSGNVDEQEVMTRFPDQFAPFLSLPTLSNTLENMNELQGIAIRMPFRKNQSIISNGLPSTSIIQKVFGSLKSCLSGSLVFARWLQNISLQHWDLSRLSIILDLEGWERQGLSKLFKAYSPNEAMYVIKLAVEFCSSNWIELSPQMELLKENHSSIEPEKNVLVYEDWLVASIQGGGKIRELAIQDPYQSRKLQPFVTIASKILSDCELTNVAIAPEDGLLFNRASCIGVSGFPFHIESTFLRKEFPMENISSWSVPQEAINEVRSKGLFHRSPSKIIVRSSSTIDQWHEGIILSALELLYPKLIFELKERTEAYTRKLSNEIALKLLVGFYKYWPYSKRMSKLAYSTICKTSVLSTIAALSIFLKGRSFLPMNNSILPLKLFPFSMNAYLEEFVGASSCPHHLTDDLLKNATKLKIDSLTPSRLRSILKSNVNFHCEKLTNNFHLMFPMIQFATDDFEQYRNQGEFSRRKAYSDELSGCPLMPLANKSVKPFPKSSRDQIAIAPDIVQKLLPLLTDSFLNNALLDGISLFKESLFLEAMFISKFSSKFIQHHIHHIIPVPWHTVQAVQWTETANSNSVASLSHSIRTDLLTAPSELLMFVLWNQSLTSESIIALDDIRNFPLLPVVSRGRQLLVNVSWLRLVFTDIPTTPQDSHRAHLKRELGRLSTLNNDNISIITSPTIDELSDPWIWINENCESKEASFLKSILGDENTKIDSTTVDNNESQHQTVNGNQSNLYNAPLSDRNDVFDEEPIIPNSNPNNSSSVLSSPLISAMQTLGVPFLDCNIFDGVPNVLSSIQNEVHFGKRLLDCIHILSNSNAAVMVYKPNSNFAGVVEDGPLLEFEFLRVSDRNKLLLEIFNANRVQPFNNVEIEKLKQLKLYTDCKTNLATSVAEWTAGVYWCVDNSVLEGIQVDRQVHLNEMGQSVGAPVILIFEPSLRELYNLIGVEELTPSTAVKKFVIPSLSYVGGQERLSIMMGLSKKWHAYREDASLINVLKDLAFIPWWSYSDTSLPNNTNSLFNDQNFDFNNVRKASELFMWTNDELRDALAGPSCVNYYAPPHLRTSELQVMFTDLGMVSELNEQHFIRLITDIQDSLLTVRDVDDDMKHAVADRGRRLLRYVLSDDRISSLLQNSSFSKKVGKVKFIPMKFPKNVEPGGHVVLEDDIGSFDQLLSKTRGTLAFSVMPILEDDLTPPQFLFSSLGITTHPSLEIVLRHLRNLINKGDSLDRWNM
eukprot:gene6758-9260_t